MPGRKLIVRILMREQKGNRSENAVYAPLSKRHAELLQR